MQPQPHVTLVGAGPGDPELLTLKGARALGLARVVLYDALIDNALLELAPTDAERIYVGKRSGHAAFSQDEINEMLVRYARSHGHVVRLKGGDPFVFGRGAEELAYVRAAGIPCSVVPGVSSAIAAAETAGIPLTHREAAVSFRVLSAVRTGGLATDELADAARSQATLVVLMGVQQLPAIAQAYADVGKADTPAALIAHATLQGKELAISASITELPLLAEQAGWPQPGVVVVGPAVALAQGPPDPLPVLAESVASPATNTLYPIFLKAHLLNILVVGGGHVGLEKASNLLASSPEARLTVVSPTFLEPFVALAAEHPSLHLVTRPFTESDLVGVDVLILATENRETNAQIRQLARAKGILTNVADTPDLCDFYLGSIVGKGDLKLAISTNGRLPTFAKRLKEVLNQALPDDIADLLPRLNAVRNSLKGDFAAKVAHLNQLTQVLVGEQPATRLSPAPTSDSTKQ